VKSLTGISALRGGAAALLALLVWGSVAWAAGHQGVVRLVDSPFPPYVLGQEGGPAVGGAAVALVRELFGRLELAVDIRLHPWKRTLRMVQAGRADGVCLLMHTAEREEFLAYTRPLFFAREGLYYHRDRLPGFAWRGFADLKPYRIGVVAGYTYGPAFMEAIQRLDLRVEAAPSGRRCLQKLIAGRIDLYVEEEAVAQTLLDRLSGGGGVAMADKPVSVFPYHLGLSRRSEAHRLLPRLDRALAAMHRGGEVRRILAAWGLRPAEPPEER
jgi:polar amino acid transport system substrate-binding protein